jgi:hypothetical protein
MLHLRRIEALDLPYDRITLGIVLRLARALLDVCFGCLLRHLWQDNFPTLAQQPATNCMLVLPVCLSCWIAKVMQYDTE